jgi:hypothetical protein
MTSSPVTIFGQPVPAALGAQTLADARDFERVLSRPGAVPNLVRILMGLWSWLPPENAAADVDFQIVQMLMYLAEAAQCRAMADVGDNYGDGDSDV